MYVIKQALRNHNLTNINQTLDTSSDNDNYTRNYNRQTLYAF